MLTWSMYVHRITTCLSTHAPLPLFPIPVFEHPTSSIRSPLVSNLTDEGQNRSRQRDQGRVHTASRRLRNSLGGDDAASGTGRAGLGDRLGLGIGAAVIAKSVVSRRSFIQGNDGEGRLTRMGLPGSPA